MSDDLGLFNNVSHDDEDDYYDYDDEDTGRGRGRRGSSRRPRRRGLKWTILGVALVVVIAGAYFGVRQVLGIGFYPDYDGSGTTDVIFQVNPNDTATMIGQNLEQAGIVESAGAFVKVAKSNSQVAGLQPGFYVVKEHASADATANRLVDPNSRVGLLKINSGWMLNDTTNSAGKVTKGILSKIADASCAMLNGKNVCVTVDQLRAAIATSDPASLGVPDWAVPSMGQADPKHRLEGLITQGVYNLKPGENAVQTLQRIMAQSTPQLQADGLPSSAQQATGFSPYQILVVASIVEREGITPDMPKIARAIYNRLAQGMRLQLDSTVDYALDRPMVATAATDQPKAGAYNTYGVDGLPPTPISTPSPAAIQAATQPVDGPWLYWVVCQKDGTSCFATTFADHQKNVTLAHQNGVF